MSPTFQHQQQQQQQHSNSNKQNLKKKPTFLLLLAQKKNINGKCLKPFQRLVRDPLVTASFEGLVPPAMVMLLIYGISSKLRKVGVREVDGGWLLGRLMGKHFDGTVESMVIWVVATQIFFIFILTWGDDSILTNIFQRGLKPPTSMVMNGCLFNFFGSLLVDVGQWLVGLDRIQAVFYKGKLISIGFSTIRLWPVSTLCYTSKNWGLAACFWFVGNSKSERMIWWKPISISTFFDYKNSLNPKRWLPTKGWWPGGWWCRFP